MMGVQTSNLYAQDKDGVQRGLASYYAHSLVGNRTASGEVLSRDSMTCAHRTLPFGTILKVTCPSTERVVYVKVNDRGPFVSRRIIDLSWEAAKQLNIVSLGIAPVIIEECLPVFEGDTNHAVPVAPWDSLTAQLAHGEFLPWIKVGEAATNGQ